MLRKTVFLIAFYLLFSQVYAQTSTDGSKTAYAFSRTEGDYGIVSFNLDDFSSVEMRHAVEDDVRAAAFAEGSYYALRYIDGNPAEIVAYDLATGNKETVTTTTTAYEDMAYDYNTQTLLLLTSNDLQRLDLSSGEYATICHFDYAMASVTATLDGKIYAIDNWGEIYSVDDEAGSATSVYKSGISATGSSDTGSLDADLSTGKLYYLRNSNGYFDKGTSLFEIDIEAQTNAQIGNTQSNSYTGLYTGYTNATPMTPASPSEFAITPASDGSNSCQLSWTCPSSTFNRQPLSSFTHATIYRNGEAVGTTTDVTPGAKATYTDNVPVAGNYTYKVTLSNEAGEGMFAIASEYVGSDVPAAPANVVATSDGKTITVSWTAPTTGLNGGNIGSNITYKVVRSDEKVIAESTAETSVTDVIEGAYAGYSYTVTAKNNAGEGGSATSNAAAAGDVQPLPQTTAFDDASDLNLWTVVDANNDGNTWQMGTKWGGGNLGVEIYRSTGYGENDDWLISPPASLTAGTASAISFDMYCTYYDTERIEVYMATAGTAIENATPIDTLEIKGSEGGFYGNAIPVSLNIPKVESDGNYCIYLRYKAEQGYSYPATEGYHINNFTWKEVESTATVSGTVIYRMDMMGTPYDTKAANALITIGDFTTYTNKEGKYTISGIPMGEYDVTAKYIKGTSIGVEHVTLNEGDNITVDFILTQLAKHQVSGTITDEKGNPIKGASINFVGYDTVTVVSGDEGLYNAEMFESSYNVTVKKNNYVAQTEEIDLSDDIDNANFALSIDVLPPYRVTAADDANRDIVVAWDAPKSLYEIAYDNGVADSDYGFGQYSDESHIMGTIFRETGNLYEVKWQSAEYGEESANSLIMSIIALDDQGNPSANVLHQATVPTVHGEWNTYRLPAPVKVDKNGFMVVFGGTNARLALDSGNENDVIDHPRTQVYSNMGVESPLGYSYFDNRLSNRSCHFLIRAVCENIEDDGSTVPALTYDVWRMPASAAQDDETQWVSVATGTSAQSITDNGAKSGSYRYAVKATYTDLGKTTEAVFSNTIEHNMIADVTINVSANSDPSHANGAKVTLYNDSYNYTAAVENGKASFANVEKGIYSITIRKNGFDLLEDGGLNFTGEDLAFSRDYTLTQSLDKPISLDVLIDGSSAKLLWNMQPNIVEDFDGEGHTDFEVNPAGNFGWSYIDNDYLIPYSFGTNSDYVQITFPHMGERMAAITFNSQATTPPLNVGNTARSGSRALAFFAAKPTVDEEGGVTFHASDDYFISPELKPYRDFVFRFYARQYEHQYNIDDEGNSYIDESRTERIRVGYSTTDTELSSFIWLDEELRRVEEIEYVEYEYVIPQEAKYVVLNSSSNDNFMLLVDDVFIGVDEQVVGNSYMPVNVTGYEVYLDDAKVTDTQETEYTFSDLANGTHTAAVVQKFATGSSDPLSITFDIAATSGIGNAAASVLSIYAYDETLYINGDYSHAMIYSTSGAQVMSLSGENQADLSALPRGIYLVKAFKADGETVMAKIIR